MRELLPIIMDWTVLFISWGQPLLFIITHYCNNYIMEWALLRSTKIQPHTNCILCHCYTFSDSFTVSGKSPVCLRTVVITLDTDKTGVDRDKQFIFAWVFAVLQNPREVSFSLAWRWYRPCQNWLEAVGGQAGQLRHDTAWHWPDSSLLQGANCYLPSGRPPPVPAQYLYFYPPLPLHTSVIWHTFAFIRKESSCAWPVCLFERSLLALLTTCLYLQISPMPAHVNNLGLHCSLPSFTQSTFIRPQWPRLRWLYEKIFKQKENKMWFKILVTVL